MNLKPLKDWKGVDKEANVWQQEELREKENRLIITD